MSKNPLLPQNDSDQSSREENLQTNQSKYQYKYDYPALNTVAMADGVPDGEKPKLKWILKAGKTLLKILKNRLENELDSSNPMHKSIRKKIMYDLAKLEIKFLASDNDTISGLEELALKFVKHSNTNRPKSVEDFNEYYHSLKIPLVSESFQDDSMFAYMRVAGLNPVLLESVNSFDENFPITDAIFQSVEGFNGDTLDGAIAENRLYMVDYKDLESIENGNFGNGQKYSYAPKALFAIAKGDTNIETSLRAIAIQCGQKSGADKPLFVPNDRFSWEIAKTIVQIADLNHHELVTHLAATHLLIEPFVVTTHRQLADNHPLKVLLLPHFEGTIFINFSAQKSLVNDGGPFDKLFSGTMPTNRGVVATRLGQSFNDAMLLTNLKKRGVTDEKLFYPYRDDAVKIWGAISNWVSDYLDLYYKNNQDVMEDTELQAWSKELVQEGHVQGFGEGSDNAITTLEYLKEAVTMVIFTASAQHAAVNFTQKPFPGYVPNMPAAGYTPAPTDTNKTEQDYLDLLPPLDMANDQVDLLFLLSGVYYTELGNYKRRYFKDKRVRSALDEFESTLEDIEDEIEQRNAKEGMEPYTYMLPSRIPQSINI